MRHQGQQRVATMTAQARAFDPPIPPRNLAVAQAQPALAALVRTETRDFDPAVTDLGLTLVHFVCLKLGGPSVPMRRADRAQVRDVFNQITAVLYNLDSADPAVAERALAAARSPQPDLMQSLEDLLLDHRCNGRQLNNAELGVLYVIARTAVAVLHDARRIPPGSHEQQ